MKLFHSVGGLFAGIYLGIGKWIRSMKNAYIKVRKYRKRYKLIVKLKNLLLKLLNLAATGYGLFTFIEPQLERFRKE